MQKIQIYLVGGAIRDALLNLEPHEYDYVITGASIELLQQHPDYQQVADNFPVFIRKSTGCEYALARTEEKVGQGYGGFIFNTTNINLVQDCQRRDFTINALYLPVAQDLDQEINLTGEKIREQREKILDPTNLGLKDLGDGSYKNLPFLRAINQTFWQDPLRFIRGLRFQATKLFRLDPKILQEVSSKLSREDYLSLFQEKPSTRKELNAILKADKVFSEFFPALLESNFLTASYIPAPPEQLFKSNKQPNISIGQWQKEFNLKNYYQAYFKTNTIEDLEHELPTSLVVSKDNFIYLCLYLCFNDYWQQAKVNNFVLNPQQWQSLWDFWQTPNFIGALFINQLSKNERIKLEKLLQTNAFLIALSLNILQPEQAFPKIEQTFFDLYLDKLRLGKICQGNNLFLALNLLLSYPLLANSLLRMETRSEIEQQLLHFDLDDYFKIIYALGQILALNLTLQEEKAQSLSSALAQEAIRSQFQEENRQRWLTLFSQLKQGQEVCTLEEQTYQLKVFTQIF
ncbi:hypothetical protein [Psittacicella gerlachiana]|uniref:Poly A polymerase head domain-containing protein n=1 Tax=Psittacicella gerlachiana TaxID=2028574 RepID=A0A3A1YCP4_9GAMM|nr:hypothetical protein [Psittacicella gerlachiana]RIY35311.1 hypothetical protein CKF59_03735 [Psittacicella gerlachiana]